MTHKRDCPITSEEISHAIIQMVNSVGGIEEHRALTYIALRYPDFYEKTIEMYNNDFSLTGIEARPSHLTGQRKIVDCIFSYKHRKKNFIEKWFCRIDVGEIFPFLVTRLSPFYEH